MPYSFVIQAGPREGMRLQLNGKGPFVLGRGADVDVQLPPEDRSVSRRHAQVEVRPDGVYLEDLAHRKSTSVNGVLVKWARLAPGNVLRLGNTLLRLAHLGSEDKDAPSSDPSHAISLYGVAEGEGRRSRPLLGVASRSGDSAMVLPPLSRAGGPEPEPVMPTDDVLICDGCGTPGIQPPSPDLWDAGWLCPKCIESRRNLDPLMPKRIGGFEVLRFLARGGMGVLYEAASVDVGIHAAIKILPTGPDVHATILRRFLREQRITQALRHPNIVRCFEVGADQGSPYIVSEFVGGGTAVEVASPSCPVEDALWLGADLFRALGYAHDLGVVHRDVKPANLLLTRSDAGTNRRAKLADFGLAKSQIDLRGAHITLTNESGGSSLTMGPEQVLSFVEVRPGADVYSAAATLFWLLTCDTPLVLPCPLDDASLIVRTEAIISPKRRSLGDLRADVPRPVVDLLDSLLTTDSHARDGLHAKEIASALSVLAARAARSRMPTSIQARKPPARAGAATRHDETAVHENGAGEQNLNSRFAQSPALVQADRFDLAMKTVEQCIHMFERAAERSAAELRDSIESHDATRIERAVQAHDRVREDLQAALAHWEELINLG